MRDELKSYIETDLLSGHEVEPGEELLLSGLVDSLGVMRLIAFIETRFGIRVPAGDMKLQNFRSIDAIATYLSTKADA